MTLAEYLRHPMRTKYASKPEMGDALYSSLSSATGDEGRAHFRTSDNPVAQARNAFQQNERQRQIDGYNETRQIPAGAWQSKAAYFHAHASDPKSMPKLATLDRRMRFKDLDISIETDQGNYRYWYDPHSKTKGKTKMRHPYGYMRMTQGLDGDHVDCFVGPNHDAKFVYVIDTNKAPKFDTLDEQKCMLGFNNRDDAIEAFKAHYDDPRFFRAVRTVPYATFKKKVLSTLHKPKKIAQEHTNTGTFNDQTPGDYLGFPGSSLVGLRTVVGDPLRREDKIDKAFRFNDLNMNSRVIDPNASSTPASPGV